MKIKFIETGLVKPKGGTQNELKEERIRLMNEASHWMKKITKLNSLYSGKILKINKRLQEIERILC